jgi:hypothetical protein
MQVMTTQKHFVFLPIVFNRLTGPWPRIGSTPHPEDLARQQTQQLREEGVLRWYSRSTSNRAPRIPRTAAVRPFGAIPLLLDGEQAREFRKRFRGFHLLRDRKVRLNTRPRRHRKPKARLAGDPTPAPGFVGSIWHLDAIGVTRARAEGWASRGAGVRVAIVDSGVDRDHPEFGGRFIQSVSYTDGAGSSLVRSPDGDHGTHIAGLIAGATHGVAPEADLLDIQAFHNDESSVGQLVDALWFAASAPNVKVVNFSAGFRQTVRDLEPVFGEIARAGILAVCASGNRESGVDCPGSFESPLTVGAVDEIGTVRARSGSGTIETVRGPLALPEVVAPGQDIESSIPGGGYGLFSGTSQATAIVSGLAALRIADRGGNLSLADLLSQLITHTKILTNEPRAGGGLVFYNRI